MKDGANLPRCSVPPYACKRVDEIPMRAHELQIRDTEPGPAIDSLIGRGYHVDQPPADVLEFPKNRKLKDRFGSVS
jgi:hypothetical protein